MKKKAKKEALLLLEELAGNLSIRLRYEKTKARGGLARIDGASHIIIDKDASDDYKIEILRQSLKTLDLSRIFLSPRLREILED